MGRGWSDCGASEADVNAPNDADRKDNKHVDTKNPSDGEKVRGTMARIAASKHLATLHSVKGGIYLRNRNLRAFKELYRWTGIESGGDYMPANPHQCRLYASRFFALAKNARSREARQIFAEMAETWNRLAAEAESDQTLLQAISERELGGPDDDLPHALKLRLGEYA